MKAKIVRFLRAGSTVMTCIASAIIALGVSMVMARPSHRDSIRSATLASDARSIRLQLSDGRAVLFTADVGDAFDQPRLSADHRRAGWGELSQVTGSYLSPVSIAVYADARLRHVACDSGIPEKWWFSGSRHVVLSCAFPHGPGSPSLQRFNTSTGQPAG